LDYLNPNNSDYIVLIKKEIGNKGGKRCLINAQEQAISELLH
jgi:hypothetical protein